MICGTRGDPGTVAPFRAWRGSRDLVAQSPKFHAPALAAICRKCREKSSTASPAQPERGQCFIHFILGDSFCCSRNSRVDQDFGFAVAAAGASGGCTSDGFTQFTLNGPIPCARKIKSPLAIAKCLISFGMSKKFPVFIVCNLDSSNFSPAPTRNAPFSTVMFSSVGCQCEGVLAPSTQWNRTTNGWPSASGFPPTTAISQPFMIGVHFKSPKCTILCGSEIPCCPGCRLSRSVPRARPAQRRHFPLDFFSSMPLPSE